MPPNGCTNEQRLATLSDEIRSLEIKVGEHKVHGTIATIRVEPADGVAIEDLEAKISETLSRYTVYTEVKPV